MTIGRFLSLALLSGLLLGSSARSDDPFLEPQGPARPTKAWLAYCDTSPDDCVVNTGEAASIPLSRHTWNRIDRINREVNRAVRPMTDRDHWGVEDRWDLPRDGYGDCEDYQILKRRHLIAAGFPRRALRMAVVITEQNEGHAVLIVRTDRGDLVLDNAINDIRRWSQTGYLFIKREGQDGPDWVSLGGRQARPGTAALR